MAENFRLLCVLAHPDDESLGTGGILARYAAEGVQTYLVTATRGEHGRCGTGSESPGPAQVGRIREAELKKAAAVLGLQEVQFLDYIDGKLDQADPQEAAERIAVHVRRIRPHVVVTFGPDGAYGHPDHIAISQYTAAAVVRAAGPPFGPSGEPAHRVSKFYYMAWDRGAKDLYESGVRKLGSRVDEVQREAVHWPDWMITTRIDTRAHWERVWEAVRCHETQLAGYGALQKLSREQHRQLWGCQQFYRVFSQVNGGRHPETDLFEGLRKPEEGAGVAPGPASPPQAEDPPSRTRSARSSPLGMDPAEFRRAGHMLVEQIADFLGSIPSLPVTRFPSPSQARQVLQEAETMFPAPVDSRRLLSWTASRLFEHSLHNGHPRFWGYITSSAAPIGMLGDFLAAAVNPNLGGWKLSPLATEMEVESVRWIAEMLGYPKDCGGLLVSGGNVANLIGFLTGRRVGLGDAVRTTGIGEAAGRACIYASAETHTWIQKAADLSGLGTDSIRWIATDDRQRMDPKRLREQIRRDTENGKQPLLVVGTAGSVSTGAIDPLEELSEVCREHGLWFHVDGAYGATAAVVRDLSPDLRALGRADSIAVDPHKWMYIPLEAGCVLVRDREALHNTFSYHPPYYHLDENETNFFDYGLQNSRGFRALKVWLALRLTGRAGYEKMIREDIDLAAELYRSVGRSDALEPGTLSLSIATFRYVPQDLPRTRTPEVEEYLNRLNREILERLEKGGEAFLSNAIVDGRFLLRACIVNFRTSREDVRALPGIVTRYGKEADRQLRPQAAAGNRRS